MDGEIKREVAFVGEPLKQKVALALTLCSVIPLLVLAYVLHSGFVPDNPLAISTLVVFTGLLMAGGGYIVWDLARAVTHAASLVEAAQPARATADARRDEIGTLMVSINRMATTIQRQSEEIHEFPGRLEQLTRQAFRDPLTGLPNRALFMDRLAHGLMRARRRHEHLAVLFLDLDRFKVVNDTLGHSAGDQLLVEVSRRISGSIRPEDTVARLGGDEFGLLLEEVADGETAEAIAARVQEDLARPLVFEGRAVFITASIGIALSAARIGRPDEILRDADLAMYHAKAKGNGRHEVFDSGMSAPTIDRMDLEMDLRSAISRREFQLHYQPVLQLDTGRITEVEALIYWRHEQRGLLEPGAFIGLAEETGLIVPIWRWALGEGCRQARVWQLEFPSVPPLAVSLKLSGKQLQHQELLDEVTQALAESGLEASCLKLEVAESAVMEDAPVSRGNLTALKGLGVRLAVDDFGKGYSSLGYLKSVPADTLKIDRSFARGLSGAHTDSAIVRAVVTVARSLNMDVTADGIETDEQRIELKALGCARGQGFLFAEPADANHMRRLLATAKTGAPVSV